MRRVGKALSAAALVAALITAFMGKAAEKVLDYAIKYFNDHIEITFKKLSPPASPQVGAGFDGGDYSGGCCPQPKSPAEYIDTFTPNKLKKPEGLYYDNSFSTKATKGKQGYDTYDYSYPIKQRDSFDFYPEKSRLKDERAGGNPYDKMPKVRSSP